MENMLWVEKYRPKTIDECVLPERIKTVFSEYVNQETIPNLLLHGDPGIGKTTVAKALCREIGVDYMIMNGSDETGVDYVRHKIKIYASSLSLSGKRKVIILDEADYMSHNAQACLRNAIEEFSMNCSFILTCNYKNKIIEPLHSRCAVVDFNLKSEEKAYIAKEFFGRVKNILQEEKVEFNDKVVAEIIKNYFPDFRRVLNELQRYSKHGKIDTGILSEITQVSISGLVKHLREGDFAAVRKWVASGDYEPNHIFRQIYDALYDIMKPSSIPKAVVCLAEYQYKNAFVADREINLVACLTELMVDCEFN